MKLRLDLTNVILKKTLVPRADVIQATHLFLQPDAEQTKTLDMSVSLTCCDDS